MGFGLSFGKKKSTTSGTATVDKNVTGTQSGVEATAGQTATSSTGTSNLSSSSTGTSTTTQNQSTNTTQTGKTTQQSFSDALAGGIESSIQGLLGDLGETASTLSSGIDNLGNFNADAFIQGVMQQAQAQQQSQLDQSINGLIDTIGGTPQSNSMSALLAGKLTNESAANLAGIRSQATGQAEDIMRQNLGAQAGAMASVNDLIPAIIQAFKGGNVTGTSVAEEIANLIGSGTTQTAEQSNQQQTTQQNQLSTTLQIINQLLNTTEHTAGTETTKEKTKSGGGGFSLSL